MSRISKSILAFAFFSVTLVGFSGCTSNEPTPAAPATSGGMSGAMEKDKMGGAMDTGKMSGAMDTGKMSGAMDKGKMDGAMEKGKMDGAMEKGKMDAPK